MDKNVNFIRSYLSTAEHDASGGGAHPGLCRVVSYGSSPCSWLAPVISAEVDRIAPRVAVSVDLFLVEMTGTENVKVLVRVSMSSGPLREGWLFSVMAVMRYLVT